MPTAAEAAAAETEAAETSVKETASTASLNDVHVAAAAAANPSSTSVTVEDAAIQTTPPDDTPPPSVDVVWWRQLWAIRQTLVIILTPIVWLPLPLVVRVKAAKCGYVIGTMAVYWVTEAIPLEVTALLPVALMPWLDVLDSESICKNYFNDTNMLFLAGLLLAVAVEKSGLHIRIALRVLMVVGCKPLWVLFGFMVVTGFISMWLNNTSCTAMMIPIVAAVLLELNKLRLAQQKLTLRSVLELQDFPVTTVGMETDINRVQSSSQEQRDELTMFPDEEEIELRQRFALEDIEFDKFSCALKLCIAYAANIGGFGTIIGCGPNIILKGEAQRLYGSELEVDFTSWFVLAFPLSLVNLVISWISLACLFLGPRKTPGICCLRRTRDDVEEEESAARSAHAGIRREYMKLNRVSFAEISVLICFVVLCLLWLTKHPGVFDGWLTEMPSHEDKEGHDLDYVTDATVAVCFTVLLFVLPSRFPNYLCFRRSRDTTAPEPSPALLDWQTVHKRMPWSAILLLGGGFALANATEESGLSSSLSDFAIGFSHLPPPLVVLIMIVFSIVVTTFTNNGSAAAILMPITARLAVAMNVHPFYLLIPVTIAASFSYILPVSTIPNVIVYSYGGITVKDMIKTGIVNCVLHVAVLMLAIHAWGYAYFRFGRYPLSTHSSSTTPTLLAIAGANQTYSTVH